MVWLRVKAHRDRWSEEKSYIDSEFAWVALFYQKKTKDWRERAQTAETCGQGKGYIAYALRQAHVWETLSEDLKRARTSVIQ